MNFSQPATTKNMQKGIREVPICEKAKRIHDIIEEL
jgi:hypothetical protein